MGRMIAILACLGLAGCITPMAWSKSGFSAIEADRDEADCRAAAWREADYQRHMSYALVPYGPFVPQRGLAHPHGPWGGHDPFAESRLRDFCMRAKGYQRVPVERP